MIPNFIAVLTYGVLCAYLGVWVHTTYLNHWKKH